MAKVTPMSIIYTILLVLVVLMLAIPTISYYSSMSGNAIVSNTINDTYQNLNNSFNTYIYAPTYAAAFNNSGGFKASGSLQTFTGLAFQFGAFSQVISAVFQGIPLINTVFSTLVQFSILPDVNLLALFALFIFGVAAALIFWGITSWTKVDGS